MNDFDITEKVVFNKLCKYMSESDNKEIQLEGGEISLDQISRLVDKLDENKVITSVKNIGSKHTGILKKIIILCKRFIRKLLFWYVEPICNDQNQYNDINIQIIRSLLCIMHENGAFLSRDFENRILKIEQKNKLLENILEERSFHNTQESYKIEDLVEQLNKVKLNLKKYEYMGEEIKRVTNDLQLLREKSDFLFTNTDKDFWDKQTVSQSGEDSIIAYVFMVLGIDLKNEYYLDLGANHAKQLSNTYMLYQQGMRGVLVEANPQLIGELKFYRGEDIILNKCISDTSGKQMHFYILNGDGLSTSSLDTVNEIIKINPQISVEKEIVIDTITINEILEQYFDKAPLLLNIDIEGQEENILRMINYEKYAPFVIIVERIEYGTTIATRKRNDSISDIMEKNGYFEYAFTGINSIFINKTRLEELKSENSI